MINRAIKLILANKMTCKILKNRRTSRAFSLVEFIIVIVILGIVSSTSSLLLVQGFRAFAQGRNILEADWQSLTALERMTRDIRDMRSQQYISTATSTVLTFTDSSGTSISYQLNGTQLMRNSQVLADNIQNLTFTYYDYAGAVTAQISAIKYIGISLDVSYNGITFTIATAIYPWNLT